MPPENPQNFNKDLWASLFTPEGMKAAAERPNFGVPESTGDPKNEFDTRIWSEFNSSSFGSRRVESYRGSGLQTSSYTNVHDNDATYKQFITRNYGSFDSFLSQNRIDQTQHLYDPSRDYLLDVTVQTENINYKTDHISAEETIMEMLSGICTVWFVKVTTGTTRRMVCTLQKNTMSSSEYRTRSQVFTPLQGDRIVVWDVNEGRWKSFYMHTVFKFTRDDSMSLE